MLSISIVIPVYDELQNLTTLLPYLAEHASCKTEIILCDGGACPKTKALAEKYKVKYVQSQKGRAKQLNEGAKNAVGRIFYFLHADTFPPQNFEQKILEQTSLAGSFRMQFDYSNAVLKFYSWFTRFNWKICRGGDRSIYVNRELFNNMNGFNDIPIMEDYDMVNRLVKATRFNVIDAHVVTSSRAYLKYGVIKLQLVYGLIHLFWLLGVDYQKLDELRNRMLKGIK